MPTTASPILPLPADLYEPTAEDQQRFAHEIALGMCPPKDPRLAQVSAAVPPEAIGSRRVQVLIERLRQVASGQRNVAKRAKRRILVGIAAPQLGDLRRVIMVDTMIDPERKKPGKLECFINPEIIWRSREADEGREGCFSTGLVYGLVRRPIALKLRAWTPEGKQIERIFEGFSARIIQHECDHLEGIRFPERIKNDRKLHWVHTEELGIYPDKIKHWPRLCSRQRWESLVSGFTGGNR